MEMGTKLNFLAIIMSACIIAIFSILGGPLGGVGALCLIVVAVVSQIE